VLGFAGGVTGGEETPAGAPPLLCMSTMGRALVPVLDSPPCLTGLLSRPKGQQQRGTVGLGLFQILVWFLFVESEMLCYL
jgi:hypothetical protein